MTEFPKLTDFKDWWNKRPELNGPHNEADTIDPTPPPLLTRLEKLERRVDLLEQRAAVDSRHGSGWMGT